MLEEQFERMIASEGLKKSIEASLMGFKYLKAMQHIVSHSCDTPTSRKSKSRRKEMQQLN